MRYMRAPLRKLLGICSHDTWQTVGTVMVTVEGDEMLIERCRKCKMAAAYLTNRILT